MANGDDFGRMGYSSLEQLGEQDFIEAAMQWHFGPAGSLFWERAALDLDFNPRTDIHCVDDLRLFDSKLSELRRCDVYDLVPRHYLAQGLVPHVFESGGTTGSPKRAIFMPDWVERLKRRRLNIDERWGLRSDLDTLVVFPSGPHFAGKSGDWFAEATNTVKYTVDMDPRWLKRLRAENKDDEAELYIQHVIDQAVDVLETQRVEALRITPPLLRRMVNDPHVAGLLREKIKVIGWGGARINLDERVRYKHLLFPDITFVAAYGSTMILGGADERIGCDDDELVFDPDFPFTSFAIIDEGGNEVRSRSRGRVVANHVSPGMLIPNNIERDIATSVPGDSDRQLGVSVANIEPMSSFEGTRVHEGIY